MTELHRTALANMIEGIVGVTDKNQAREAATYLRLRVGAYGDHRDQFLRNAVAFLEGVAGDLPSNEITHEAVSTVSRSFYTGVECRLRDGRAVELKEVPPWGGVVVYVGNADEPELFIPVGPPMKPFKNDRKTR